MSDPSPESVRMAAEFWGRVTQDFSPEMQVRALAQLLDQVRDSAEIRVATGMMAATGAHQRDLATRAEVAKTRLAKLLEQWWDEGPSEVGPDAVPDAIVELIEARREAGL